MARSETAEDNTIAGRVKFLIKHTGGTMAVTMIVYSEADAAEANKLLAASRDKAAKLIDVKLEKRK